MSIRWILSITWLLVCTPAAWSQAKAYTVNDVAAGILDRAADELAELALSVARLLFPAEAEFPVALHGGVFNAQRVLRRLTAAIRERYPRARVSKPTHSPGVAAALLILHDLRVEGISF